MCDEYLPGVPIPDVPWGGRDTSALAHELIHRWVHEGADPAAIDPIRSRIAQAETPDVLFATACITSSDGQPLAMLQSGTPPMSLMPPRARSSCRCARA